LVPLIASFVAAAAFCRPENAVTGNRMRPKLIFRQWIATVFPAPMVDIHQRHGFVSPLKQVLDPSVDIAALRPLASAKLPIPDSSRVETGFPVTVETTLEGSAKRRTAATLRAISFGDVGMLGLLTHLLAIDT
jgi:hypothetical protein